MKTIIFVIHQLNYGGAQRVLVNIMNNLNDTEYNIKLILFNNKNDFKNILNNNIEIHVLNVESVKNGLYSFYKLVKKLQPDILFSGISFLNVLISVMIPFLPKNIKYIARETSIVTKQLAQEKFSFLFVFLYKYFYANFDIIIAQSEYMKNDLIKSFNIPPKKLKLIHNPINIKYIENLMFEECNEKIDLLCVGRLDENKNFKVIIKSLTKLQTLNLYIIGEGNERSKLENLVIKLNLQQRVKFLGFQNNPYKYMKSSKLLIVTSLYEGFPNVILEANFCGLPVVAFDCPGGTKEIINNGINGFLVECNNVEKLVDKIKEAINYNWNTKEIKKLIIHKYSISIYNQYKELF